MAAMLSYVTGTQDKPHAVLVAERSVTCNSECGLFVRLLHKCAFASHCAVVMQAHELPSAQRSRGSHVVVKLLICQHGWAFWRIALNLGRDCAFLTLGIKVWRDF